MMHNPPQRHASDNQRNLAYLGQIVKTTDGRTGVVEAARNSGIRVIMRVIDDETGAPFDTDSEHATIVRPDETERN